MKEDRMVSIIVPVYNVEKYLHKCIESILHQTYQNLEIVLINDGSVDQSGDICEEYAKIDNRIKVIHKKNGGPSVARNIGLEIFSGEYVCFVDSDDWIDKDYIEKLMHEGVFDLSICRGCLMYYEDTEKEIPNIIFKEKSICKNGLEYSQLEQFIKKSLFGYSCGKLYNKKIVGNKRFLDVPFREDLIFNISILKDMKRVVISDCIGYHYRQRNLSLLHSKYSKPVPPISFTCEKLIIDTQYYSSKQCSEISSFILKTYLADILQVCIMNNDSLDNKSKIKEIKKILNLRKFSPYLKYDKEDNALFKLLSICYKFKLSRMLFFILRRIVN